MPVLQVPCLESASTIVSVANCPDSKSSWDRAAERKGCHRISDGCVGLPNQKLEYHCVANPYMNETVEVCAPSRRMFGGFCPEYSFLGGGVQENFAINCKKFWRPCPIVFTSTDTYKYQGCYKMINRQTTQPIIETSTKANSGRSYFTNSTEAETKVGFSFTIMFIMLGTTVIVVLTFLLIGKLMCSRKKLKQHFCWRNDDVESRNDEKKRDIADYGTDNNNPDSSSHLLSNSKHDQHRTDVQCSVDAKQPFDSIAHDDKLPNNDGKLYVDSKPTTNNGDTKGRTSNG